MPPTRETVEPRVGGSSVGVAERGWRPMLGMGSAVGRRGDYDGSMLPDQMRALVFEGPGRLALRDWPVPQAGAGEILVRVHTATICGTDLRIVSGRKTRDVRVGRPIGHECSGTVAQVGDGVTAFAAGDRVAVHPVVTCGRCAYCTADRENLCPERITLGYHTDGAFAEYMLIPARAVARGNLFKLPDGADLSVASVLEPAGCCVNGQREMGLISGSVYADATESPAPLRRTNGGAETSVPHPALRDGIGHPLLAGSEGRWPPESLLVIGAGPIGLLHVMIARAARPGLRITVVEPREHRRAAAAGIAAGVDVADPAAFEALESFDAVILAAGVPEMVNAALRAVRKEGRVNLFAGFDAGSVIPADLNAIHYKQLHVTGASESRRRDFAEALWLLVDRRVDLGRVITHRFRLESYEEAFRVATDATALKVAFAVS